MRMNIRLVRASQFLKQFKLDIRHKSEKQHIMLNALSRLINLNHNKKTPEYFKLDAFYICSLINIFDDFRYRMLNDYKKDSWYTRLI